MACRVGATRQNCPDVLGWCDPPAREAVLRTLAARLIDVTTREDPMATASSTATDPRGGERAPSVSTVVVVGRAPEKMREAAAVLEADDYTVVGVFSEDEALSAIAEHPGLLAVVAGGSVSPTTRRRPRTAAPVATKRLVGRHLTAKSAREGWATIVP